MDSLELPAAADAQDAARKAERKQLRIRGLAIALPCWAVLAVAAWLSPSDTGTGTHRKLGLPPCNFLATTGYPCPTCGMTTSMSAMAHGQFALAWLAQPFGMVLFAACVVAAGAGTFEAYTGRNAFARLRPRAWWAFVLVLGVLAGWGLKVWAGIAAGTWPMR